MLWVRFKINPELGPPIRGITWSQRFRSLKGVWGMVVLIILVMGSIYTGLATPTESAAVGAIGAFLMALPRLNWRSFKDTMLETAKTSGMIFAIIARIDSHPIALSFLGHVLGRHRHAFTDCAVGTAHNTPSP
jgi:TRAP-type mannitol/chloroaromatic compound transport system permease large subunit